eukprot:7124207-Pyramimonas_sp.AAC.1
MQYFGAFGLVESVKLIKNQVSGQSKGFCFVTFTDPAVATTVKSYQKVTPGGHLTNQLLRRVSSVDWLAYALCQKSWNMPRVLLCPVSPVKSSQVRVQCSPVYRGCAR